MKLRKQPEFNEKELKKYKEHLSDSMVIVDYYLYLSQGKTRQEALKAICQKAKWSRATFFRKLSGFNLSSVVD
jgi:hypothetical protein